jgi:type II secretory pathway component PulM
MRDWFDSLEQREKLTLSFGVVAAVLIFLWAFVWSPLRNGATELDVAVAEKSQLLATLQRAQAIGGAATAGSASPAGQELILVVDQTHRSHGLAGTLARNQPDGPDGIRVTFQSAPFESLMDWLVALQRDGVAVESATFDGSSQPGLVTATLVLRRS